MQDIQNDTCEHDHLYTSSVKIFQENNEPRRLMMTLPFQYSFRTLIQMYLTQDNLPDIFDIDDLFEEMCGQFEYVQIVNTSSNASNRVAEQKITDHDIARDAAVRFAIGVVLNMFTHKERCKIYNVYLYIQTHAHVFTQRIRYHVKEVVEATSLLTPKQKKRVQMEREQWGKIGADESEEDTEDSEDEDLHFV